MVRLNVDVDARHFVGLCACDHAYDSCADLFGCVVSHSGLDWQDRHAVGFDLACCDPRLRVQKLPLSRIQSRKKPLSKRLHFSFHYLHMN